MNMDAGLHYFTTAEMHLLYYEYMNDLGISVVDWPTSTKLQMKNQ